MITKETICKYCGAEIISNRPNHRGVPRTACFDCKFNKAKKRRDEKRKKTTVQDTPREEK